MQSKQILRAFHLKDMAYTGQGLNLVEVGADALSGVHGTFVVDSVKHAGNFEIDAVEGFARDDRGVVDARRGTADDFVVFGILELDGFEIGRWQRSCFFRECAVSEGAFCGLMDDAAGRSGAFRFGDGPGLRGSGNKHLAARGANAAERIPVHGSSGATTGALRAVLGFVKV